MAIVGAPSKQELEQYIRQAAIARGIDPNIAVRVARSEGLNGNPAEGWQSNSKRGDIREPSYGPYQLLVGGPGTGYPVGLGNEFIRATGLDPTDPATVQAQIDFALDKAAQNGWSAWYGADAAGVSKWDGLQNAQPIGVNAQQVAAADIPVPTARPEPAPQAQSGLMAAMFPSMGAQAAETPQAGLLQAAAQPYTGTVDLSSQVPVSDYASMTGAPYGTAQMPVTGGMGEGLNVMPTPTPPQGIDAMTTASNRAMSGMPNLDPSQPLDLAQIPVPAQKPTVRPLTAPQAVPQRTVAGIPAQQTQSQPMSVPGGYDFFSGRSDFGMDTGGGTLSRNAAGDVTRYNPEYDKTYKAVYSDNGISYVPTDGGLLNLPSQNRLVDTAKGFGARAAGGLLGSALLGPVGGLLGAYVANNLAQGKGLLGRGGKTNVFPAAPNAFPTAPRAPMQNTASIRAQQQAAMQQTGMDPTSRDYSPAAYDSINSGQTVGLF